MGNTIVKAGTTLDNVRGILAEVTGEATLSKGIQYLFSTSDDMELDRVRVIQAFVADGFSQREILAAVLKDNGGKGIRGFSKSTIGRYAIVAGAITGDDLPRLTPSQSKRATLAFINLANTPGIGAQDVKDVREVALKAKGGAGFVAQIEQRVNADAKREYLALTKPQTRAPHSQGGTRGKGAPEPVSEPQTPAQTPAKAMPAETTPDTLRGATTLRLVSELTRRVGLKAFTPDDVLQAAFDALAAAWEERVNTGAAVADITA